MKTETDRKLYTYVTGVNTLDKYKEEHSYHYLPDVIMPPSQDSYNIEDILSEDQINAIKLFEDKKIFYIGRSSRSNRILNKKML